MLCHAYRPCERCVGQGADDAIQDHRKNLMKHGGWLLSPTLSLTQRLRTETERKQSPQKHTNDGMVLRAEGSCIVGACLFTSTEPLGRVTALLRCTHITCCHFVVVLYATPFIGGFVTQTPTNHVCVGPIFSLKIKYTPSPPPPLRSHIADSVVNHAKFTDEFGGAFCSMLSSFFTCFGEIDKNKWSR